MLLAGRWKPCSRLSALFALAACTSQPVASSARSERAPSPPPSALTIAPTEPAPIDAGTDGGSPAVAPPSFDEVARILYGDHDAPAATIAACPATVPVDARVGCLFDERYRADPKAASLAREMFTTWQVIAGVEPAQTMDGGYRGLIRLEPTLPVNAERKHLEWVSLALRDFDRFFADLEAKAAAGSARQYRFRPIQLRFTRSVAARTPSAYASGWTVAWNVAGSLHTSPDAARETLFHEIFHLNDAAHAPAGADAWSPGALGATFDAVVRRCGTRIPCLGPYSPNETIVRGGTYYSFQPGNGVREYAAELALRYYREQRAAMRDLPRPRPFKCGPPENGQAWALMRDEYFDGVDLVPACR